MDNFKNSINKILEKAIKSFARFPMSIFSALIISLVAFLKIGILGDLQETTIILLNSIQLAFLFGAIFSMATTAYKEVYQEKNSKYWGLLDIVSFVFPMIIFVLLYFFGKITINNTISLSTIAISRVLVATFISAIAFIYIASNSKNLKNFSEAFFVSHKAFVVAAIYGLVLMIGVSGVLVAFQNLIYKSMSYDVYLYLGVIVGFVTFAFFLGNFPYFGQNIEENQLKAITKQPKFIEILFEYILVPIMLALSLVLLIWAVRVLLVGLDVSFNQLSSITSSYVIVGIWLHIMVKDYQGKLASYYRSFYPFSGLLILALELWALIDQVSKFGVQTTEYAFAMLWIFALISILILIAFKDRKYQPYKKIAILAAIIASVWVMPILGYQDFTFKSQVKRLETILVNEMMLENNNIIISTQPLDQDLRYDITNVVDFLAYSEKTNKPQWFKKDLDDYEVFKQTFGFEKTYSRSDQNTDYSWHSFYLKASQIDISNYSTAINANVNSGESFTTTLTNNQKEYQIIWEKEYNEIPLIKVTLNDKVIIEKTLDSFLDKLTNKYLLTGVEFQEVALEDMTFNVEDDNIAIMIVFSSIDIYDEEHNKIINYSFIIEGLYLNFK